MSKSGTNHHRVAIVGSGFSGLGMGIRLKQQGQDDFVILERSGDVGGVWRDNSYPGCACDVQSHLYSFSFAQNPNWARAYSPSSEIWAYLRDCADRFGVRSHCRFNHTVHDAAWDDERQVWRLRTSQGTYTADVLVAAMGALSEPATPELPGLPTFKGKVMHSARWDHGYPLDGRKVAVVGTGASAVQFVPIIQKQVSKLVLFQRTAPWVMPRHDRPTSERMRSLFRAFPPAQSAFRGLLYALRELLALLFIRPRLMAHAERIALRHLAASVSNPELREKLTPDYTLGCKRVLVSDDYLSSLDQKNVELVTAGLREVREHSVVTADGVEHEVDAIILATGFHVTDMPFAKHVRGRTGRTLAESFGGSPKAYLGTTVHGFPNLFMLSGPNTGLGHTSVLLMIEPQIEHVLKALRYLRREGLAALEPKAEAQNAFVREVDRKMTGTVWTAGGCASWYLDATGRNSTLWPGFTFTFRWKVERFLPLDYIAHARRRQPSPPLTSARLEKEAASG
ncbi:MAG TPA: NAD(P)/FAD-dependent oxidoreductase [Longimicrobium sp.]|nr:NAD(P)/FAD-dependent oxidoreductase [Longimicrobium sp.]